MTADQIIEPTRSPGFGNRCEKTLNEGRHVCLLAANHDGECRAMVNALWPPSVLSPQPEPMNAQERTSVSALRRAVDEKRIFTAGVVTSASLLSLIDRLASETPHV